MTGVRTVPAPEGDRTHHVRFTANIKVDVTVDVAAYYQAMRPEARKHYLAWNDKGWLSGDGSWSKPIDYLVWDLAEDATPWGITPGSGGVVRDDSDGPDDWETWRVAAETRDDRYWSPAAYEQLLDAVPWMATAEPGRDPEAAARRPGPNDVPLFDLPGDTE